MPVKYRWSYTLTGFECAVPRFTIQALPSNGPGQRPLARFRWVVALALLATVSLLAGDVRVDAAAGQPAANGREKGAVNALAFDPTGSLLAAADDSGAVTVWDVTTGVQLRTLRAPSSLAATSVEFNPGGTRLVVSSRDSVVRLWDVSSGGLHRELRGHGQGVLDATFSADGRLVYSAAEDTKILAFSWACVSCS